MSEELVEQALGIFLGKDISKSDSESEPYEKMNNEDYKDYWEEIEEEQDSEMVQKRDGIMPINDEIRDLQRKVCCKSIGF